MGGNATSTVSQPGTRKGWVVNTMLRPLHPREIPGVCTEGCVGFVTGLDDTKISPLDQRIVQLAIPTALSRPCLMCVYRKWSTVKHNYLLKTKWFYKRNYVYNVKKFVLLINSCVVLFLFVYTVTFFCLSNKCPGCRCHDYSILILLQLSVTIIRFVIA
jgi:hypothetical protein